jgi:hypothetical protein
MQWQYAAAGALSAAALALPASPALAAGRASGAHRPAGPAQQALASSRRSLALSRRSLAQSRRALDGEHTLFSQTGTLGHRVSVMGGMIAALQKQMGIIFSELSSFANSIGSLQGAVGDLAAQVDSPYSGLGKVDDGVIDVYLSQSGGSPAQISPLFAADIPQAVGAGASTSGTVPVTCSSAPCTLSIYASDDSNRPQPAGGSAASYVGGAVTVSSVSSSTAAESFYFAGETPPNSKLDNSMLVPIPSRQTLGQLVYPGPSDSAAVEVPIDGSNADGSTQASGTIQLSSPGEYIVSGTFNFIGALAR